MATPLHYKADNVPLTEFLVLLQGIEWLKEESGDSSHKMVFLRHYPTLEEHMKGLDMASRLIHWAGFGSLTWALMLLVWGEMDAQWSMLEVVRLTIEQYECP